LHTNGFYKDRYGYEPVSETIYLSIYIDRKPEKDDFWSDGPPEAVWFTPLAEIYLESRHNRKSHKLSYHLAKKLAKVIEVVIYDHQVDVVYAPSRKPCDHFKTGEKLEKYGAGINPFMDAVCKVKEILQGK
jgi:hypothetical protein